MEKKHKTKINFYHTKAYGNSNSSNITIPLVVFLSLSHLCSMFFLYQQQVQIENLSRTVDRMTLDLVDVHTVLTSTENELSVYKNSIYLDTASIDLISTPVLNRIILTSLTLALSYYGFSILKAKWLGFSLFHFLPKIAISYHLFPFISTTTINELFLKNHTIHITLIDGEVSSILRRGLNQLQFSALETYLNLNPNTAQNLTTNLVALNAKTASSLTNIITTGRAQPVIDSIDALFNNM